MKLKGIPPVQTEWLERDKSGTRNIVSRSWYDYLLYLAQKINSIEAGESDLVIGVDVQAWSYILDGIANGDYEAGDILYWSGSGFVPLNIGDEDQVLTVSGSLPSWQDAAAFSSFDVDTILTDGTDVLVGNGNVLTS